VEDFETEEGEGIGGKHYDITKMSKWEKKEYALGNY
jgi:hypothetical protein